MCKISGMFPRQEIEEHIHNGNDKLDQGYEPVNGSRLEAAASSVCSTAAKLAIECDLDTFDNYLGDLMSAIRHYQILNLLWRYPQYQSARTLRNNECP